MAFSVPTFPLTCNIYTITPPSTMALRLTSDCNLAMGRRINWIQTGGFLPSDFQGSTPALLLPPLTDIRDPFCGPDRVGDVVEVPAGSGRWYAVTAVDDVAKGFDNEYRFATLMKIASYAPWSDYGIPDWPTPIP